VQKDPRIQAISEAIISIRNRNCGKIQPAHLPESTVLVLASAVRLQPNS
jgi:hypothetical protein